eukprot:353529-Chlamydomonas_euryale.AAC.5
MLLAAENSTLASLAMSAAEPSSAMDAASDAGAASDTSPPLPLPLAAPAADNAAPAPSAPPADRDERSAHAATAALPPPLTVVPAADKVRWRPSDAGKSSMEREEPREMARTGR